MTQLIYQGQQPGSRTGSIKITQDKQINEPLSVAQAAAVIDRLHGVVDPCLNERSATGYDPEQATGTLQQHQQDYLQNIDYDSLAADFGGSCLAAKGKPVNLDLSIYWSNELIAADYKLICPVGTISNQRRVQQKISLKIEITKADHVNFGFYVFGETEEDMSAVWVGKVVDKYGKSKEITPPRWDLDTSFYFEEKISGTIYAEFITVFDIWTITLFGVYTKDKRDYSATITALWSGGSVRHQLEVPSTSSEESANCPEAELNKSLLPDLSIPGNEPKADPGDPLECWQQTIFEYLHPCSGTFVRREQFSGQVPCPEEYKDKTGKYTLPEKKEIKYIGYGDPAFEEGKNCAEDCTAEGYEKICNYPPPEHYCVPICLEYRSKNLGGLLPAGGLAALKEKYGEDVIVEFIWPEDGDCGEYVDKLQKPDTCQSTLMYSDEESPDVVTDGESITVYFTGGTFPLTVELTGTGFYLHSTLDITKQELNSREVVIYTRDSCGSCSVNGDDGCGQDTGEIRSTVGQWSLVSSTPAAVPCGGATKEGYCVSGSTRLGDVWCAVTYFPFCLDMVDPDKDACGDYDLGNPGTGKVYCYITARTVYRWTC